jgi:hypothetical protein
MIGSILFGTTGLSIMAAGAMFYMMLGERDAAHKAAIQLSGAQTQIVMLKQDSQKIQGALQHELDQAQARAAQTFQIRNSINAAPASRACASSPAIGAVLHGLRRPAGNSANHAPADPG